MFARDAIARIDEIDPVVNAVQRLDPEIAQRAVSLVPPQGTGWPLAGMPLLIKDNIETAGPLPTTAGSLALRRNVTGRDAFLVQRLKSEGAVVIGKAAMSEWSNFRSIHAIPGWSATGGLTRNPHVLDRIAGSSSSGSAAAVAAGMVPAAIGTEANGSITSPASINGVVGMKPSVGLVSRRSIISISDSQGTPGPLACNVPTARKVLAAMAGSDPFDPLTVDADRHRPALLAEPDIDVVKGMRIGVMRFDVPDEALVSFEEALEVLASLGAQLVDIPTLEHRDEIRARDRFVMLCEFLSEIDAYLAGTDPAQVETRCLADVVEFNRRHAREELALFGQDTLIEALGSPPLDDPAYLEAREISHRLSGRDGIGRMLRQCGARVLVGATQRPARRLDVVDRDPHSIGGACLLAAASGYPHLSVPMAPVQGLPAGLSIVGPKWSDALVLSVGQAFERAAAIRCEPEFRASLESAPETQAALKRQAMRDSG
jgi:amidase